MPHLDPIALEPGEVLPPGYSLVAAGRNDSKVAVSPPHLIGTYGRWDRTALGRARAIDSAWRTFGYTRAEWSKVVAAAEAFCVDDALLRKLRPEACAKAAK